MTTSGTLDVKDIKEHVKGKHYNFFWMIAIENSIDNQNTTIEKQNATFKNITQLLEPIHLL